MSEPSRRPDHAQPDQARPTDESRTADEAERQKRSGRSAAAARIESQGLWVDQQIRVAMARGEFDDLPGQGKPIEDLGGEHDRDWWLKKLIEREQVTGVLPPALQLRTDDAGLDALLDHLNVERDVRRELEDFNARVMRARYTPVDGPPLITQPRDVEAEVAAWRERRAARRARHRAATAAATSTAADPPAPTTARGRRRRRWRLGSYRRD